MAPLPLVFIYAGASTGFAASGSRRRASSKLRLLCAVSGPPELSGAVLLYRCGHTAAPRRLALDAFECGTEVRGIRASLRERSLGVLWDGSQTLCCLMGKSGFVFPRERAWRLSARADWRQPSSGVLADVHQMLCCLMIKRVVSSNRPPHFCRARSRPLICNARRHITHHSSSRTPAAALAAEARA